MKLFKQNHYWLKLCIILAVFLMLVMLEDKYLIANVILAESIYLFYKQKNNIYTIIIFGFILWSNYSFLIANVYSPIPDSIYSSLSHDPIIIEALLLLYVFMSGLLFVPIIRREYFVVLFNRNRDGNMLIFCGGLLFLVLTFFYGFEKPEETGDRGAPSSIYEYSIIVFIFSYYYSKYRWQFALLSLVLFLFCAQNIIYGGRVTALQLMVVFFLCIIKPNYKIKKYIPYIVLAFIVFTAVGSLRGEILMGGNIFTVAIDKVISTKLALDTSYSAFYCSLTFLKVLHRIDVYEHLYLIKQYICYLLFGSGVKDSNLSEYTFNYYEHTYGGVLPFYAYFYLFGYFGVLLLNLYIKKIFKLAFSGNNFSKCFCLYFVATTPRWFLYSPSPITRGLMFFFIIYTICTCFDRLSKKYLLSLK